MQKILHEIFSHNFRFIEELILFHGINMKNIQVLFRMFVKIKTNGQTK